MNKIPVGQTIAFSYRHIIGHLGTVAGIVWLPMLIAHAASYSLYDLSGLMSVSPEQMKVNPALALRGIGIGALSYLVMQMFSAIVAVAIIRRALDMRSETTGVYLAFGRDEMRMCAGYLRYFFAAVGVFIIVYVVLLLMNLGLRTLSALGPGALGLGGLVAMIGMVVLYSAAVLTLVRMGFLLSPSVLLEKGGGIKRSYELTKGNFWRIVGVWLAIGLPWLVLYVIVELAIVAPHVSFDIGPWPQTPDAVPEFSRRLNALSDQIQAEIARQGLPLQAAAYVYSVVSIGFYYAATTFAYRSVAGSGAESRIS